MYDLSSSKKQPLYYKVYEILMKEINSGKYAPNDQLPTEMDLCKLFSVSRITIRQALELLEKNNYIYRKLGIGTFVTERVYQQDLKKFYSFTDEMIKIGKIPKSIILSFEKINCPEKIAEKCNIDSASEVYLIKRLRLADDFPMMLEYTYLPAYRFDDLSEKLFKDQAMYSVFKNHYAVIFTKAIETFKPVLIKDDESALLEVPTHSAGMMIERYTFEWDSIIEYTVSVARGDKFIYRVVLD